MVVLIAVHEFLIEHFRVFCDVLGFVFVVFDTAYRYILPFIFDSFRVQ